MLDTRILRKDPEAVAARLKTKGFDLDVAEYRAVAPERATLQQETEHLQAERNRKSQAIGQAKARGDDIAPMLAEVGGLGDRLHDLRVQLGDLQDRYQAFLRTIPNLPDASVPEGTDEADNVQIRRWGELPRFEFEALDHVDLCAGGALDFEAAAKVSGARYVVMKGAVARLHRALIQFMLDTHVSDHGYTEIYVPYILNAARPCSVPASCRNSHTTSSCLPVRMKPTWCRRRMLPVTNVYRETILDADALPIRHVCHTPCFRREAGSYGRDTRGMFRQHQFEKVELVQLTFPGQSWQALEELTGHAEAILKKLELPYRAVVLCGGDLGFASAKTIDLEVWLPGQNRYREISSCSNFLDFQARRMMARYRSPDSGKPEFVHTLNGSGLPAGRTLIAILENHQDGAGKVAVPDVLRDYMGGAATLDLTAV